MLADRLIAAGYTQEQVNNVMGTNPTETKDETIARLTQQLADTELLWDREVAAFNEHVAALTAERDRLREALKGLLIAVEFNAPPKNFGKDNPCFEARVPVGFTDAARAALKEPRE